MAVLDLIEYLDPNGDIIVMRLPDGQDSGEIRLGSQLVVQESQIAFFYRDGKFLDSFGPGRHTLRTNNLPLLGRIIGAPFGGRSPFRSYVYFVATKTFINLGWGTSSPVLFRDADFRMISLRAYGAYSIRIIDYILFLNTIVGTRGLQFTQSIEDFFRTIIVSHLNEVLGAKMKSILDLSTLYHDISETIKEDVRLDFRQYGIQLVDLIVEAITPPPEVQQMINKATGVAAQDVEKYRAVTVADATLEAAKNPSGGAGSSTGAGIGLGIGLSMAQTIAQAVSPGSNDTKIGIGSVKEKLEALKSLLNEDLISEADYEEQKKKLLSQL